MAAMVDEARLECDGSQPVHLAAGYRRWLHIVRATYGDRDVTEAICKLVDDSGLHVEGGIRKCVSDTETSVPERLEIIYRFLPTFCIDWAGGDPVTLSVPEGFALKITRAHALSNDVTSELSGLLQNNSVTIDGTVFSRMGQPTYPDGFLIIGYVVVPLPHDGAVKVFTCRELEAVDIVAQEGYTINILYATYGSMVPNRCVTAEISGLVTNNSIHVSGGIHSRIGDPEPGYPKTLTIFYQFVATKNKT